MAGAPAKQRSAVVFGALNLGRAVLELLVSDGWAVAGVARSRSTLDGVSASGALAVEGDVEARITAARELGQEAEASGVLVCVETTGLRRRPARR
jgi:nucleoside-diphosphate-sugar epimerase